VLEFDAVTKRFGELAALDGCTFAVQPGRLTGFLGPNGAGKTTAMRAVFGLVELDAGRVRWRGTPRASA
jgi:ABC-2 type transport system ATP-binding protein